MGAYKNRRAQSGPFIILPLAVLQSPAVRDLPALGKRLLIDLLAAYRFPNNGDLCVSFAVMRARGWTSRSALQKAVRLLLAAGLIELTRQGSLHKASLYAFTWMPIDECGGKLDVRAPRAASGLWKYPALPPKSNRPARRKGELDPARRSSKPLLRLVGAFVRPAQGPKSPLQAESAALHEGTFLDMPCHHARVAHAGVHQTASHTWSRAWAPHIGGGAAKKSGVMAPTGSPSAFSVTGIHLKTAGG